jgi:hypothetical protein
VGEDAAFQIFGKRLAHIGFWRVVVALAFEQSRTGKLKPSLEVFGYLLQRPESMAPAELKPGAWLVSLELEATELQPQRRLQAPDGRPVWLYRI